MSTRVIDYGISNTKDLITSQSKKRGWCLSDYLPILVKTDPKNRSEKTTPRAIFDRAILKNGKTGKIIRITKLPENLTEMSAQDCCSKLAERLKTQLLAMKILKMEKPEEQKQ